MSACTTLEAFVCNPCIDSSGGGIRAVAFIKNSYDFIDFSDPIEWAAAVASGDAVVIPFTRGEYDGGTPVKTNGFGWQKEEISSADHTLTAEIKANPLNVPFFNTLTGANNLNVVYLSEKELLVPDKTAIPTIWVSAPITSEKSDKTVHKMEITWSSKFMSIPYAIPTGIFDDCI